MMGSSFSPDWYVTATSFLIRYQEKTVRGQEEKKQKEQEKIKEQIKHLLDPIQKMHEASLDKAGKAQDIKKKQIALIKYVYENHPPKNPEHKLKMGEEVDKITDQELQKILQKAITHYHPDKVNEEEHGKAWKVLTEEICKRLTTLYTGYKGV